MADHEQIKRLSRQGSVPCKILIDQDGLDGLNALIHWLTGFSVDKGRVPGTWDLIMMYRTIEEIEEE